MLQAYVWSRDSGGQAESETWQSKRGVFEDNVSRAEKKGAPKPDLWMAAQRAEVLTLENGSRGPVKDKLETSSALGVTGKNKQV